MAWQKGELISAAECERIATMLHNLSISHDVDYGGDAIRQAGRQLRTRTDLTAAELGHHTGDTGE